MGVIWCNSLGNSHFQIYVKNFIEIVIDHCLLITSHVSHAIASCIHYTSYSLLNLVHNIVCDLVMAIQDKKFLDFNAKCVKCVSCWGKIGWKTCFGEIWVEFKSFWKTFNLILMHFIHKTFNLILMHFIHKTMCFEEFLH